MTDTYADIPDIDLLRRIRSLSGLSDGRLVVLANQLNLLHEKKGRHLLHQQDTDPRDIYLVEGKVELVASDGKRRQLAVGPQDDIVAIAQLRPSVYDVIARSKVDYLLIDTDRLREFVERSLLDINDISVHTLIGEQDETSSSMSRCFFQHLIGGLYQLPPLPSAAARIQKVYRGDKTDTDKLVNILVSYPDMVRVLETVSRIRTSKGIRMTDRIRQCLQQLGTPSSYYLMMIYSIGYLIHRLPAEAFRQIQPWWEHCLDVAAISRMLAKKTGLLSPDLAMMTGLIHGIGAYSLVDFLARHPDQQFSEEEIQQTFITLRAQVSGLLLRKWNVGNNVIVAAEECAIWSRQPDSDPDLCDLILVANYISLLKDDKRRASLPDTGKVPAFNKFGLTEAQGLEILEHADTVKDNIKKLFSRLDNT